MVWVTSKPESIVLWRLQTSQDNGRTAGLEVHVKGIYSYGIWGYKLQGHSHTV